MEGRIEGNENIVEPKLFNGMTVKVLRHSGEMENDWEVQHFDPESKRYSVIKDQGDKPPLLKSVAQSDLESWNS